MAKKMLIDATHPEETRVVVVDGNKVEEFDFETLNKRQLAGNIYLAKVTRVEPSLQAAFVDYGGNRHGFLAFAEIHPDYYQIPTADRKALIDAERAAARAEADEENGNGNGGNGRSRNRSRSRGRSNSRPEATRSADAVTSVEITGMDVVDLGSETGADSLLLDSDLSVATPENRFDAVTAVEADFVDPADDGEDDGPGFDYTTQGDANVDPADEIESVADEDVTEEISAPRRPRPKQYKIQEVVKVRQVMLVQVVKEERGNKGAALTTYLSLAGRYCVLMPNTARGGGISRKITNAPDRKKLKEIASEIEVPEGAGLIIRTAGAKRTKHEIKRDYEYLCRLWEQIRDLTFKSMAPAPIYEEGDLIKRSIRDLYSREIEEVLVEGNEGFRTARDFMKMIMPSNSRAVQAYVDQQPLFARYQVESYLASMFNPVVQLKSGGYIVIGITEALVAIDVNSGRATKEGSIEDTALKTNLEACDEVARQLRLRDLAGLIVIDFIDMEERKNNASVEKRLKDKLKTDRARIQVGRISGFGLMEMSRQRLRPGMLESTTQPCSHCHGTGLIRSDDSQALAILRALEEEGVRKRSREVLLKAPIAVINYLFNNKREHIAQIESRYGMAVRMEADPSLVSPDYVIEKFKTATRVVAVSSPVVSHDASVMPELDEEEIIEVEDDIVEAEVVATEAAEAAPEAVAEDATETAEAAEGDNPNGPRKKRRRRRRRRGGAQQGAENGSDENGDEDEGDEDEAASDDAPETAAAPAVQVIAIETVTPVVEAVAEEAPAKAKPTTRSRSRSKKVAEPAAVAVAAEEAVAPAEVVVAEVAAEAPAKPKARRAPAKPKAAAVAVEAAPEIEATEPKPKATRSRARAKPAATEEAAEKPATKAAPKPRSRSTKAAATEAAPEVKVVETVAPVAAAPVVEAEAADQADGKPRRKGWWSK